MKSDLPARWHEPAVDTLENDSAGSCLHVLLAHGGPFDPSGRPTATRAVLERVG